MCQQDIWRHLLQRATPLTIHKLAELVDFCSPGRPEMRSEVLREAARRKFSGNPQTRRTRLTLTIQGWGMPETFQVADGFQSGEAAAMLHVVGEKTTMVEVHQRSEMVEEEKIYHLIVANVNHSRGELGQLGLALTGLQREKATSQVHIFAGTSGNRGSFRIFTESQKAFKAWRARTLYIDADKDNWAALADIASMGEIQVLVVITNWQLGDVRVED